MEYRAAMLEKKLSASTVHVRLFAIRKLVGEAQRNGILDAEQAAKMTDVPNLRQQGTRFGNWLTRDQGSGEQWNRYGNLPIPVPLLPKCQIVS
jgi:hypothetical protein